MKRALFPAAIIFTLLLSTAMTLPHDTGFYHFKTKTLDGAEFDLSKLKGKKVLIVNTASECGYTPQYADLQKLHEKYGSGNFVILGFPCNQFGGQEPLDAAGIKTFCSKNYGVTFQMMEKTDVKGETQHPLYAWLTHKAQNGVEDAEIKWNFDKFLIDENGHYVKHLLYKVNPMNEEITKWIEGK